MAIADGPHYTVTAEELARWVERHPDKWWATDGYDYRGGYVSMPCPSDEYAAFLRRTGVPLLVEDGRPAPRGRGEAVGANHLDGLTQPYFVDAPDTSERYLYMAWTDHPGDWMLMPDALAEEMAREEALELADPG